MPRPLHLAGKWAGRRRQLNHMDAGGTLIYLKDDKNGTEFLVDTGATCSVIPFFSDKSPSGPLLTAANGRLIPTWGTRAVQLSLGHRLFIFNFLLAAVNKSIIGNDFLARFDLLVDPARRRVLDASTMSVLGVQRHGGSLSPTVAALAVSNSPLHLLLSSFPSVLSDAGFQLDSARHGVEHVVETTGRPVFAKARRLAPDKLLVAESEFKKLEAAGIIRRSNSAWSSPLHMVPKKDGTWRPCGDYRRLNLATTHDRYPLPNILDFANNLHGCTVFSKIDLVKGYYQVPMAPSDVCKTAIVTPFGLFEFLRMPFGLKNAAQTFQRLMDKIFAGLPYAFIYLNDILVASKDMDSHLAHLKQVLAILSDNGLVVNLDKCVFGKDSVEFLGHKVSASGLVPLPQHVEAV